MFNFLSRRKFARLYEEYPTTNILINVGHNKTAYNARIGREFNIDPTRPTTEVRRIKETERVKTVGKKGEKKGRDDWQEGKRHQFSVKYPLKRGGRRTRT